MSRASEGAYWLVPLTWGVSTGAACALFVLAHDLGHVPLRIFAALALALLGGQACCAFYGSLRGSSRTEREPAPAPARLPSADSLHHARRLEIVGELAVGVAHDFNNTLTVILSYGDLLRAQLGPSHSGAELAERVVQAAEHGAALTKQLLNFARKDGGKVATLDARELLETTQRSISRMLPRSIQVSCAGPADEPLPINVDALKLQQAVLNLVLNARDAMPYGGELQLVAEPVSAQVARASAVPSLGAAAAKPCSLPEGGTYIAVRVRDTGIGISPDVLPHVFEAFFTTKEPGRGTGLGLSNVREIAEESLGLVSVTSELGRGTEFSLYFPRAHSLDVEAKLERRRQELARARLASASVALPEEV